MYACRNMYVILKNILKTQLQTTTTLAIFAKVPPFAGITQALFRTPSSISSSCRTCRYQDTVELRSHKAVQIDAGRYIRLSITVITSPLMRIKQIMSSWYSHSYHQSTLNNRSMSHRAFCAAYMYMIDKSDYTNNTSIWYIVCR